MARNDVETKPEPQVGGQSQRLSSSTFSESVAQINEKAVRMQIAKRDVRGTRRESQSKVSSPQPTEFVMGYRDIRYLAVERQGEALAVTIPERPGR
jgi:hypothetical protein